MKIVEINEYNIAAHEASVKVTDGIYTVECFSQPCMLKIGMEWVDPLECLNVYDIYVDDSGVRLSKVGLFEYEIVGKLIDCNKGLVTVGNLCFHIDAKLIPKDIHEGQHLYFIVDRIDIY